MLMKSKNIQKRINQKKDNVYVNTGIASSGFSFPINIIPFYVAFPFLIASLNNKNRRQYTGFNAVVNIDVYNVSIPWLFI